MEQQMESLTGGIEALKQENETLKGRIKTQDKREKRIETLQRQVAGLQGQVAGLQGQVKGLKSNNKKFRKVNNKFRKANDKLLKDVDKLRKDNGKFCEEINKLRAEAEVQNEKIQALSEASVENHDTTLRLAKWCRDLHTVAGDFKQEIDSICSSLTHRETVNFVEYSLVEEALIRNPELDAIRPHKNGVPIRGSGIIENKNNKKKFLTKMQNR
jgi:chromosome segregation ATPase